LKSEVKAAMNLSTASILDLEFKTLETPVSTSASLSMPMPITDSISRNSFSLNLAPSVDLRTDVLSTLLSVRQLSLISSEIKKNLKFM
jgi:hypothetical protein